MKKDIILSGVGGQGILSIAATIGMAAVDKGWFLKQAEVHGMSQRGGDVQSHLRISENVVHSDLIPFGQADMILSVEPMESLRYLPYLHADGWLVTNSKPFINVTNYPETEAIFAEIRKVKNHILIDADGIAADLKAPKSANMVMLGAAFAFLGIEKNYFENAIQNLFGRKGEEVVAINLSAFNAGIEFAQEYLKK
ncbi:MAG: indolepyruvate oxidoreductase [Bacteroidetes bacterium HGW-Bacteroidetes-6]|jgi:indolepyruvate ferredoxin oxidoreductase beta subunit|nr:MAG: indolepyruvate oxidoreductase [Bacteroidetes bacterium HGW-Bacteroidetes-6]